MPDRATPPRATRSIRAAAVLTLPPTQMTIRNFGLPHPTYQCLAALRCLALKEAQPARWRRLQEMEAHHEQRQDSPRAEQERFAVAQFILRMFPKLRDEDKVTEDDILKVCGILQVSAVDWKRRVPVICAARRV